MPLTKDKALTLTGILLALFLGALDQTIVSTALPRIVQDLRGIEPFFVGGNFVLGGFYCAGTYLRQTGRYVQPKKN